MASPSPSKGSSSGGPEEYNNNKPYGLINGVRPPRKTQIKWTDANDKKLLLIGLGKELSSKEYRLIAEWWSPEKPTPKAIMERYQKLRKEQKLILEELHLGGREAELPEMESVEDVEARVAAAAAATPKETGGDEGQGISPQLLQAVDAAVENEKKGKGKGKRKAEEGEEED